MLEMIWCIEKKDIRRCKLCQDTSDKGIKFRKQFGLDAIPECPFKGKSALKFKSPVKTQAEYILPEKQSFLHLDRTMSMKLWKETWQEFEKHGDNSSEFSQAYGLTLWLAGVGKTPGRDAVCEKRAKLMWELRNYALQKKWLRRKIILVGNSRNELTADLGDYDCIGIFNNPMKPELVKYATHHFMRSDAKDLSHHGGEDFLQVNDDSVQIVLCDGGKHAKDLQKQYPNKKFYLTACRQWATTYPKTKAPSTGFGMMKMYQSWGWDVTLACFTWEGLKVHGWDYEREECSKMVQDGKLKVIDCKMDQLTLVPMQMSSAAPLNVKKPCGCKGKKGA